MNESTPPPQFPPQTPPFPPPPLPPYTSRATSAPGDNPEDRAPITNPIQAVEAILRQPRRVMFQLRQPGAGR